MLVFAALPPERICPAPTMTTSRQSFVLLALLIVMVSAWLWPALGMQFFFAYGDNAIHGLPLAELHARILEGSEAALWTPLIYGGHPLFAETQGAFANPVNMLLGALLPPLQVSILLHWLGMVMSITGMFALCRVLSLSPLASAFAALAAVMSPIWLGINNNMTVMAAVGWVPWALWSFELWLKRPSLGTTVVFGAMTAMLLLPGYPHLLHASVLYMAVSLLPTLLHRLVPYSGRSGFRWLRSLLRSGAIAVLVTVGLTAVQTLPLLELIGQSHRSQGVGLPWFIFPVIIERGLFFWMPDNGGPMQIFPVVSSTLTCMLAAAAAFWMPRHRIIGIALAVFLLGHLGAGRASTIFEFFYTHNLIPGLRSFRITHPFLLPAIIGIAVLSAAAIDGILQRRRLRLDAAQTRTNWLLHFLPGLAMATLVLVWAAKIYVPGISRLFLATAAIALLAVALTCFTRQQRWLAPLLLVLLLAETVHIKFVRPDYQPVSLLQEPAIVQQIPRDQRRDYKFLDLADTAANLAPDVEGWYPRLREAVGPSTNLKWDVPSIGGAFALNLQRHAIAQIHLRSEAGGQIAQTTGLRLIDLLGIRYITAATPLPTAGFTLLRHDADKALFFYRNDFAQPRFQHYDRAIITGNAEAAFEKLKTLKTRALVIEADELALDAVGASVSIDTNTASASTQSQRDDKFSIVATHAKSDDYRFDVSASRGGWLFLADNMYPGWIATLNGKPTPVFAAQVMGKAVWVPAGQHKVEIRFVSRSFLLGLAISIATLAALLLLLIAQLITRRRRTTPLLKQGK